MSLARTTARGALWTAAGSLLGRGLGLVSTLILTRFLAPEVMGEVAAATVLCFSASWLSHWGFGQYMVVKGGEGQDHTFHAVVLNLVLGTIAIGSIPFIGHLFESVLEAPGMAAYLPGMALSIYLRRISGIAERVLLRELKFRELSVAGAVGEIVYSGFAILFVTQLDMGGLGIVWANVIQSTVLLGLVLRGSGLGWLTPTPLSRERFMDVIRFGAPLGAESLFHQASRTWDKLLFSSAFGPAALGHYNLAYNLADLPAVHIGEHVASALQPSFVRLDPERRGAGLRRALGLLCLVVFPLGLGLSAVADPLITVVLPPEWHPVAPLLTLLCAVSLFRPIGWVISTFIQTGGRTWGLMYLEALKLTILVVAMAVLSTISGPVVAASAVGLAFGVHTIALAKLAERMGGPAGGSLVAPIGGPLLAGGAMWAAVMTVDHFLHAEPLVRLAVEIPLGAVVYVGLVWTFARSTCRDALDLLLRRGSQV